MKQRFWGAKGLSALPGCPFLAGTAIRSPLPAGDSDPHPPIARVFIDFHEAALVLHDPGRGDLTPSGGASCPVPAVLCQTGWWEVGKRVRAPALLPALCSMTLLSDYFSDGFSLGWGSASVAVRRLLLFPGESYYPWGALGRGRESKTK